MDALHATGPGIPAPGGPPPRPARGPVRWLMTSNPLYALSAVLVLYGLRMSFDTDPARFAPWALMIGLAVYTLLLAGSAVLLVRAAGAWEDVRTLLLLVVLMFLATSVTFDDALARDPKGGRWFYLGGLAFAVAVSEGLLRSLRLHLPVGFRLPYYLGLALFFLYPIGLSPWIARPSSGELHWGLFGFATAAGLVTLTLIPAARRGAAYVHAGPSPWRWPYYPWSLFVFLGVGVLARSYYLCVSFHFVMKNWWTVFGPYFLAPFVLAVGVLLLEAGRASGHRPTLRVARVIPVLALALACLGHRMYDPVYRGFLLEFRTDLGMTPAYLVLVAAVVYYAYAMGRRIPHAGAWLTATLVAFAWVGPQTVDLDGLTRPHGRAIAVAAAVPLALGLFRRERGPVLVAAGLALLAIGVDRTAGWGPATKAALIAGAGQGILLVVGLVPGWDAGRWARRIVSVTLPLTAVAAVAVAPGAFPRLARVWVDATPLVLTILALGYGRAVGMIPVFRRSAAACLASGVGPSVVNAYRAGRSAFPGLDAIVLGLVCLGLALLVSLAKVGVLWVWVDALRARRFPPPKPDPPIWPT